MHNTEESYPTSDGPAIALGCIVGLVVGGMLGVLFMVLLGASDVSLILVMHTMLAMMVMGGWTAPSLLSRDGDA